MWALLADLVLPDSRTRPVPAQQEAAMGRDTHLSERASVAPPHASGTGPAVGVCGRGGQVRGWQEMGFAAQPSEGLFHFPPLLAAIIVWGLSLVQVRRLSVT